MKRILTLFMAAFLILALAGCSATLPAGMTSTDSKDSTGKSQSNGKKVLFVGRDGGGDKIVANRLKQAHGFEVTVIDDKSVTTESANGYALIFVSESVNSGRIKDKFVKLPIPVIYAEPQSTSDTGMTITDGFGKLDAGNVAKSIRIKDSKHQLAAGLEGVVDVYKDNGKMGYAEPGPEAIVVATVPDEENKATIFAYEKGVKNAKGNPVAAREVFIYLFNGEEINQSDNGWKLFDAAVQWAAGKK
jgi:hypothetical protein